MPGSECPGSGPIWDTCVITVPPGTATCSNIYFYVAWGEQEDSKDWGPSLQLIPSGPQCYLHSLSIRGAGKIDG